MDAAHRNGDGSIRLSYISLAASAGALYRSFSAGNCGSGATIADFHDAFSDFLQDRTA